MQTQEYKDITTLIVDDSGGMRKLLRIICNSVGITNICESKNGAEALQMLRNDKSSFRLILCDHTMPEMTGLELLRHVREDVKTKAIPFVVVTAENDPALMEDLKGSGVSSILGKPFTSTALKEALSKIDFSA